jgi:Fe-S cluster assembly protein SufB
MKKALNEDFIREISADKNEPDWMLAHRLRCFTIYKETPLPTWGPDLSSLDLDQITYYSKAMDRQATSWDEVPQDIKETFDKLGIPKAERDFLAGVGAQYESTAIYHSLKSEVAALGVIFIDMDEAVQKYPEIVKKHFMKVMPATLHKFAALHGAVWSGGTFLYIPVGVTISQPLQAYFRMNAQGMGQFEHTLIIVESRAQAHYIEGCSAPRYGVDSLHAGGVEIYVKDKAKFRYSSVESWSKDAYNLNTKRSLVEDDASMEWMGGNFGSQVTMLYPCSILKGHRSSALHIGLAFAGRGQVQDTGAKVIHLGRDTSSNVVSKSLSAQGGKAIYRGLLEIAPQAQNAIASVRCDTLMLDDKSFSDTIPQMKISNETATIAHEATAGRINPVDMFYLRSRGLNQAAAEVMIVNGFIDPITKELPLEYAVEMNRLVEMEIENGLG